MRLKNFSSNNKYLYTSATHFHVTAANALSYPMKMVYNFILRGEQFRPAFKFIGELSSKFEDARILMLTGTITADLRDQIYEIAHLQPEDVVLSTNPDR